MSQQRHHYALYTKGKGKGKGGNDGTTPRQGAGGGGDPVTPRDDRRKKKKEDKKKNAKKKEQEKNDEDKKNDNERDKKGKGKGKGKGQKGGKGSGPPPNANDGQTGGGFQNGNWPSPNTPKNVPCYNFSRGSCRYGNECSFRHNPPMNDEEKKKRDQYELGIVQSGKPLKYVLPEADAARIRNIVPTFTNIPATQHPRRRDN